VVAVSPDGLLRPIGFSQVARPALALAARGFALTILTLEYEADLADTERLRSVSRELGRAGVTWCHARFTPGGSPASYARNVSALSRLMLKSKLRRRAVAWIRGFPAAPVGVLLRTLRSIPYVYDIRGYWVAQRAENWPPVAAHAARVLEKFYYRQCGAAVSLTELGVSDIRSSRFGFWPVNKPAVCITTCVDYDTFTLDRTKTFGPLQQALANKLVVSFVGSVNTDYKVRESMRLFAHLARLRSDARLLCVSAHEAELRAQAAEEHVPKEALIFIEVSHDRMPLVLSSIDWGLLLLQTSASKRGSMPTKLGEFFAAGVRPVHYGCNSEVGDWVRRTGSGFSLPALDDASLHEAAERIARTPLEIEPLIRARGIAESHFSLRAGCNRYAEIMRQLSFECSCDSGCRCEAERDIRASSGER